MPEADSIAAGYEMIKERRIHLIGLAQGDCVTVRWGTEMSHRTKDNATPYRLMNLGYWTVRLWASGTRERQLDSECKEDHQGGPRGRHSTRKIRETSAGNKVVRRKEMVGSNGLRKDADGASHGVKVDCP